MGKESRERQSKKRIFLVCDSFSALAAALKLIPADQQGKSIEINMQEGAPTFPGNQCSTGNKDVATTTHIGD